MLKLIKIDAREKELNSTHRQTRKARSNSPSHSHWKWKARNHQSSTYTASRRYAQTYSRRNRHRAKKITSSSRSSNYARTSHATASKTTAATKWQPRRQKQQPQQQVKTTTRLETTTTMTSFTRRTAAAAIRERHCTRRITTTGRWIGLLQSTTIGGRLWCPIQASFGRPIAVDIIVTATVTIREWMRTISAASSRIESKRRGFSYSSPTRLDRRLDAIIDSAMDRSIWRRRAIMTLKMAVNRIGLLRRGSWRTRPLTLLYILD